MEADIASQSVGLGSSVDFSLWSLFLRADIIVKSVIILLIACSIFSWALRFKVKNNVNPNNNVLIMNCFVGRIYNISSF